MMTRHMEECRDFSRIMAEEAMNSEFLSEYCMDYEKAGVHFYDNRMLLDNGKVSIGLVFSSTKKGVRNKDELFLGTDEEGEDFIQYSGNDNIPLSVLPCDTRHYIGTFLAE